MTTVRSLHRACLSLACLWRSIPLLFTVTQSLSISIQKGPFPLWANFAKLRNEDTHPVPGSTGRHQTNGPSAALVLGYNVNPDSVNKFVGSGSTFSDVRGLEKYSHASREQ